MEQIVLLNSDYSFLNIISWQRAMCLVVKNKVEVLKYSNKTIMTVDKTLKLLLPQVLRLIKLVRTFYKRKVPFSKKNLLIRDSFTCQYCGSKSNKLTVDHMLPRARGGKKSFENCVACCKPCNNKKQDRTPTEARMFPHKKPYQPTIMEFFRIRMRLLGVHNLLKELGVY